MDEDVDIPEGTTGRIGVEIWDESPAFENEKVNVLLLQESEEVS